MEVVEFERMDAYKLLLPVLGLIVIPRFSLPAAAFQVLTVCLSFHALQRIYPSTILPTFNSSTTSATSSATKQLLQGWGASIDIVDYVFEKEDCIYVCQFTVLVL